MKHSIKSCITNIYGPDDVFYIDSCVLIQLHYHPSDPAKAAMFSNFINELRKQNCKLRVSALNLQEALHAIEKISYKQFCLKNKRDERKFNIKQYRQNKNERLANQQKILKAFKEIKQFYKIVNGLICSKNIFDFAIEYHNHFYEPIDYILTTRNIGSNFITMDGDFVKDKKIEVYC